MADPVLVKILKEGSEAWNSWRKRYPEDFQVDLSYADLSFANLSNADLMYANLRGIDLRNADLSSANLHGADLSNAILCDVNLGSADLRTSDLSYANLSFADLRDINLSNANLRGADLSQAYLNKADLSATHLSGADLENADWTDAVIGWTIFGDLDLRSVIGLETVKHDGPSTIGLDTIYRSHGQIPEVFLRKAGVPEIFIANMRSLVASMSPIEFYSCFISCSHQDEDFAKRLYADLQAREVRCWFADEDLKIGDHYHQRIDESIRLHDKLILILSGHAVQSAWVEREVVAAREKEDREQRPVLFPIRLDDTVMDTTKAWAADVRRRWHIGDFTKWREHDHYQIAFERLLRDLKAQT